MKVKNQVNSFKSYCYTDGHPNWITIERGGVKVIEGLNPNNLQDLIDCLTGLRRRVVNSQQDYMLERTKRDWNY